MQSYFGTGSRTNAGKKCILNCLPGPNGRRCVTDDGEAEGAGLHLRLDHVAEFPDVEDFGDSGAVAEGIKFLVPGRFRIGQAPEGRRL